jgi:bifunctional DNA-binding transcriptional regulator/antitoxin component of YhaV-PrlF toxin-antitoxin module
MKIWSDYRVTIPKKLRDKFGFLPGTEFCFVTRFGQLYLEKVQSLPLRKRAQKKR